jgi:hypothetical protein
MTQHPNDERRGFSPPETCNRSGFPAGMNGAARRGFRLSCGLLLAIGIVGCGPGYQKGVNAGLDKPVHADKQVEKQPEKQPEKQADKQPDKQVEKQADKK